MWILTEDFQRRECLLFKLTLLNEVVSDMVKNDILPQSLKG